MKKGSPPRTAFFISINGSTEFLVGCEVSWWCRARPQLEVAAAAECAPSVVTLIPRLPCGAFDCSSCSRVTIGETAAELSIRPCSPDTMRSPIMPSRARTINLCDRVLAGCPSEEIYDGILAGCSCSLLSKSAGWGRSFAGTKLCGSAVESEITGPRHGVLKWINGVCL